MKAMAMILLITSLPIGAGAAVCADGVWRAGCVGPHGAAVVHKPYYRPYDHRIRCADGIYRSVCKGPNGAAVERHY